jgi:hypothetical protein
MYGPLDQAHYFDDYRSVRDPDEYMSVSDASFSQLVSDIHMLTLALHFDPDILISTLTYAWREQGLSKDHTRRLSH